MAHVLSLDSDDYRYIYEVGNVSVETKIDSVTIDEPGEYRLDSDIYANLKISVKENRDYIIDGNNHVIHGWVNLHNVGDNDSRIIIKNLEIRPPHSLVETDDNSCSCFGINSIGDRIFKEETIISQCRFHSPFTPTEELPVNSNINENSDNDELEESYELETQSPPIKKKKWWFL